MCTLLPQSALVGHRPIELFGFAKIPELVTIELLKKYDPLPNRDMFVSYCQSAFSLKKYFYKIDYGHS